MNKKYQRTFLFFLFSTVFSTLLLSGCGFHLRGNIDLPALFDRVLIVDQGVPDIARPLQRVLIENKSKLVETPQAATAIITLLSKGVNRRAVAISAKEVKEYEIQISVAFAVQDAQGKQQGKNQTVTSLRRYSYDSNLVLGSANEETILIAEMREDIVQQIIRRLAKM